MSSTVFSVAPPFEEGLPFVAALEAGSAMTSLESRKGFVEIGRADPSVGLGPSIFLRKGLLVGRGAEVRPRGDNVTLKIFYDG